MGSLQDESETWLYKNIRTGISHLVPAFHRANVTAMLLQTPHDGTVQVGQEQVAMGASPEGVPVPPTSNSPDLANIRPQHFIPALFNCRHSNAVHMNRWCPALRLLPS